MTLSKYTAVDADANSPDQITVWVGVHGTAKGFPSSGRLMVVEAEPERAKELRHLLRERSEALVCEEVLTADKGAPVTWNRFNDPRFNGPNSLTLLRERFPNLQQVDVELRHGKTLGDLLENWAPRQSEQAMPQLHLVLRQGEPLAALAGLGPWLSQLESVQMILPWPGEIMRLAEKWLSKQSFRQDPDVLTMWQVDPIAKKEWLLNQKEKEIQGLLAANQQLNSDCAAVRAERNFLLEKVQKFSAKLDKQRETQDLTVTDFHRSRAATGKLRLEKEGLQHECQQLTKERSELLQKIKTAEAAEINSTQALQSIFPMHLYREENIDLVGYSEENLLLHYIQHGQREGRMKTYQELHSEWKSSLKQCEEAEVKLEQLESQFALVQLQLETLKDLFARLANRQESQRQDKKE